MLVAQDEMSTFTSLSPLTIGIASNVLQFSFNFLESLLRLCWFYPLFLLNLFFDWLAPS